MPGCYVLLLLRCGSETCKVSLLLWLFGVVPDLQPPTHHCYRAFLLLAGGGISPQPSTYSFHRSIYPAYVVAVVR